jgi:hypothetical protein
LLKLTADEGQIKGKSLQSMHRNSIADSNSTSTDSRENRKDCKMASAHAGDMFVSSTTLTNDKDFDMVI